MNRVQQANQNLKNSDTKMTELLAKDEQLWKDYRRINQNKRYLEKELRHCIDSDRFKKKSKELIDFEKKIVEHRGKIESNWIKMEQLEIKIRKEEL